MIEPREKTEFQELSPLICSQCGSAIPLPDADSVPCIYCGASVLVPEEYRRGHQARARLESIRNHARNFLSRLGRRPGKIEVLLSQIPSYAFFVILIILVVTFFRAFMFGAEYFLTQALEVNLSDYLPQIVSIPLFFGSFFIFIAAAIALYFYIRRRVFVTRRLLSVLAAGEPVKPGGPATCRRCGAPFEVKENDLVAACAYCGTENFLQVPHEWLSETRQLTKNSGRNVFWAEREYDREIASSRRSLKNQLIVLGAFFALLGGAFLQGDSSKVKIWQTEVAKNPRLLFAPVAEFPPPELDKPYKVHGIYRSYTDGRYFSYEIALRKNETLKFTQISGEPLKVVLKTDFFGVRKEFSVGKPVELTAEIGGWYKLTLINKFDAPLPEIKIELER